MHTNNINLGGGTLYFKTVSGEYQDVGTVVSGKLESVEIGADYAIGFDKQVETTIPLNKFKYKKWYKKRKGNRYVHCYIWKSEIDPKLLEILEGKSNRKKGKKR